MDADRIYREYARMIYIYIYQMCHDADLAEDIVQTTFLKAIQHADSFKEESRISSWLCQIAKNTYYDYCRKKENRNISYETLEDIDSRIKPKTNPDIEGLLIEREQAAMLRKMIHELGEPFKEILMLRIYGECSYREIGELYGKSENWARVNYYRGKMQVLERISENQD